jgi:uncharacterized membrane protein
MATATPKQTVMSKQKIGWGLVALAFVLVLILVRYATLFWLEVLTVPIMGLVALGLTWALSDIIIGSRPLPNPRRRLGHGLLPGLRRRVEELPLSYTHRSISTCGLR